MKLQNGLKHRTERSGLNHRNNAYFRLKFDSRFEVYLKDIERATGRKISEEQKRLIKKDIESNDYHKLTPKKSHSHRSKFNKTKPEMISGWEEHYGEKWPTYDEPILSRKGKMVRYRGQKYDVHEIVENSWGGNHVWYNAWPARFPTEHQQDIHRKNGPADKIFNQRVPKKRKMDIREEIRDGRRRRRVS